VIKILNSNPLDHVNARESVLRLSSVNVFFWLKGDCSRKSEKSRARKLPIIGCS